MAKNNILMVAFQFPPMSGSSGLLRVLKFCRYLPEFNWTPTVVTAHPCMYEDVDDRQLRLIPEGLNIVRAYGLDAKRHLSVRGRYPRLLALPDRWTSWSIAATLAALGKIRREKIEVVFTTYPIASAIWIGLVLHWLTGKPWIVDFRDSMTEDHHPADRTTWRVWRWLEKQAIRRGSLFLFTARSTVRMYQKRYPELAPEKCLLLPNGYDEMDFTHLPMRTDQLPPVARPLRLLHSGLVYPKERDPLPFFRALARLHREGKISSETLNVVFRAPGCEDTYNAELAKLSLSKIVYLLPRIPYNQALEECAQADALLVMQAASCDHQIPAKAYEYVRIARPILALTTQTGDTAALLNETGGATIVDLADEEQIAIVLPRFLEQLRSGTHSVADPDRVRLYARRNQAKVLADALSRLIQSPVANSLAAKPELRPGRSQAAPVKLSKE